MIEGMRLKLGQQYAITNVCNTADLLAAFAQQRFALAIVDLTLDKQLQGLEMMPLLRAAGTQFLVFSGTATDWHIRAAIRHGARGYVNKRGTLQQLCDALQAIESGKLAFPPEFKEKLLERIDQEFPHLGPAEKETLDLIVSCLDPVTGNMLSNKLIARELNVSVNRAENLMSELMNKFKIHDRKRTSLLAELKARGYFPGVPVESFRTLGIKL